jgi:preprotein translocase subunit SecG
MYGVLLGLHLLVCLCLVAVILVQSGKGGGLAGGAFGGATQTVFGGRGATDFITRATVVLGVLFFVTSLSLALITTRGTGRARSVVSEAARRAATSAPATPATGAPAPTTPAPAGSSAPATPPPAAPAPGSGTNR